MDNGEDRLGGYDTGYRSTPCFWGREPGSLLLELEEQQALLGMNVLDIGAGEGKNSAWLASRGCQVEAVEINPIAIAHGFDAFAGSAVTWTREDAQSVERPPESYDAVVAYGLMHCLPSAEAVYSLVGKIRSWTVPGGWVVLVAFNDRDQDLDAAHPGFLPTLISHEQYLEMFTGWDLVTATDRDLYESHPDLGIEHHHSMTRILARKPIP